MYLYQVFSLIAEKAAPASKNHLYELLRSIIRTRSKDPNSNTLEYVKNNREKVIGTLVDLRCWYSSNDPAKLFDELMAICADQSPVEMKTITVDVPNEPCEVIIRLHNNKTFKMFF